MDGSMSLPQDPFSAREQASGTEGGDMEWDQEWEGIRASGHDMMEGGSEEGTETEAGNGTSTSHYFRV